MSTENSDGKQGFFKQPVMYMVAELAGLVLVGMLVFAFFDHSNAQPQHLNGDTLGQEQGESYDDYHQRAADTLAKASGDQSSYALVTFSKALDPQQAAEATANIGRVDAMLIGVSRPFELPEPVKGETRKDVYQRELDTVGDYVREVNAQNKLPEDAAKDDNAAPNKLTEVIVYDTGDNLRSAAKNPNVADVEVLPPDAAWGSFGVRPVTAPGVEPIKVSSPSLNGIKVPAAQ